MSRMADESRNQYHFRLVSGSPVDMDWVRRQFVSVGASSNGLFLFMTFDVIITSNIYMPISQLSFSFHLQPLILVTAVLWVIKPLGYSVNLWVEVCRWDTETMSGLCVFFSFFFIVLHFLQYL